MELFRPWVLPQRFSWDGSPAFSTSKDSAKPATRYGHARALDMVVTTHPFSLDTLNEHRLFKTPVWRHIRNARLLVILSVPLIYACAIPFVLLDLSVTLYQAVCFPIFRVPKVRRRDYLIFDRGRLAYLNAIEKVGCVYCSYANGLLAYIAEIAARTEQRFCPIRHAHSPAQLHSRYSHFLPYGDARAYRAQSEKVTRAYEDLD